MCKTKLILTLFLFFSVSSFAQKATLSITFLNSTINEVDLMHFKKALRQDFLNQSDTTIKLVQNRSIATSFNFHEPQFINLSCSDKTGKQSLSYLFYISPGDNLFLTADFSKTDNDIKVIGKGSDNNQPFLIREFNFDAQKFYGDTLPDRVIGKINKEYLLMNANFETYKKTYHPSPSFIKDWTLNLKYLPIMEYFSFKSNNAFKIKKAYERNAKFWDKVQDSLFTIKDLNNDYAINIPSYLITLATLLHRKKESLWQESFKNPVQFYKDWYNSDVAEGRIAFQDDMENDLNEKIIIKYFTGKTAEYLYVILIENALVKSSIANLPAIFGRFEHKYPNNEYVTLFKPHVDAVIKKQAKKITDKMIFANDNGINLNTFEEVLALIKGKTVLLDMWGTWCGPCREELEKNGKVIKDYFAKKGLDYLYIANFDIQNKNKWKELIPYFDMQGLHILANDKLTKDIMDKTKGKGYPTYVIVKKDGSFELSKAGYPMNRGILIKQLEEALSLNTGK